MVEDDATTEVPRGTSTQEPSRPPQAWPDGLHRARTGPLGGVATGLARTMNVAPCLVRAGFVFLSFFGGMGVVAYAGLWLFLPEEGTGKRLIEEIIGRRTRLTPKLVLTLGAAAWVMLGWLPGPRLWPLVVIGLGAWLVYRTSTASTAPSTASTAPVAPGSSEPDVSTGASWEPPPPSPWWDPLSATVGPPVAVVAPPRRRSLLPLALVGIGVVVLVASVLQVLSLVSMPPFVVIALCFVTVVGTAILGGSRGRWLSTMALAVPLAILLLLAAVLPGGVGGGVATKVVRPTELDDLDTSQQVAAGTLTIDLRDLAFRGQVFNLKAEVGAGKLVVVVPRGVGADVEASAFGGRVDVFGTVRRGVGVRSQVGREGAEGAGKVNVKGSVGLGEVEIREG